jgi:hypothetical protein
VRIKTNFILYILIVGIFIVACNKKKTDCANSICTEEYRTISIKVEDITMPPMARLLTKFYTKNKTNDTLINSSEGANSFQWDLYRQYGYPVVSDGQISRSTESMTVEFFGEINGKIVAQETLVVGHDCCHVFKISGKDTTVMTP